MLRYIMVRTIWIFIVLLAFLSILFVTIRLVPEYPPTEEKAKETYYAKQESDGYMTVEIVENRREVDKLRESGIDQDECKRCAAIDAEDYFRVYKPVPIAKQYVTWITNILTKWDWGRTTRVEPVNVPVFQLLETRLPVTMKLNFISLLVFMPVGFSLGILAALKKNSVTDNLISLGVMAFISIPSFVIFLLLVMLFGYNLEWLPTQFPASDVTGAIRYKALVLPVLGLSFGSIAGLTRLTRAELTEVLTSEFLLLARTKGLTRKQAVVRHAMRNSMVPLVPSIIFAFVTLLSGSIIIETIYSIPGMGRVYIRALENNNFDYNLLVALSAFYTSISLFAVLVVDLTYGIVDPRIRMGARK